MAGKIEQEHGGKNILYIHTKQDIEHLRVIVLKIYRQRMEIRKGFLLHCRDCGGKKLIYPRKQQKSRLIISNSKLQYFEISVSL